jgi:hypothetical protein
MRRLFLMAVVLAALVCGVFLGLGVPPGSSVSSAQGTVLENRGADHPCPPIGTEGPPERDLPESVTCANPAASAPVYCP